ncbi:hypothetical protein BDD12DRAFT_402871 [Trichophaea hybrida]|nr:hypothetical protein BDD12DRAFT_402871 [Trichophaea hybrida]
MYLFPWMDLLTDKRDISLLFIFIPFFSFCLSCVLFFPFSEDTSGCRSERNGEEERSIRCRMTKMCTCIIVYTVEFKDENLRTGNFNSPLSLEEVNERDGERWWGSRKLFVIRCFWIKFSVYTLADTTVPGGWMDITATQEEKGRSGGGWGCINLGV